MKNKKIKNFFLISSLINIILVGVYGYLVFTMEDKNQGTAALYAVSHEQSSDKERTRELEHVLKDTEADRERFSGYISAKTNAVTCIEQVEKIGKDTNVTLLVNSVSDSASVKDRTIIQLTFSATGSFQNMYRLIALVESLPYKVIIKKASLRVAGEQKSGNWTGDFTITLENLTSIATTSDVTK